MDGKSNWNFVDHFTLHQAACLWCNLNPAKIPELLTFRHPSEVVAAKQMLVSAITSGKLSAGKNANQFSYINEYSGCLVSRDDLQKLAESKDVKPSFLFDTILSIDDSSKANDKSDETREVDKNAGKTGNGKQRSGRPEEYDWNTFVFEIIRRANSPDGLPETQAELVKDMLEWFSLSYDKEPSESSVKSRISPIYRYLDKVRNSQA